MDIELATTKLADAAHSLESASRLFGRPIGRKYIQRLGILRSVANIDELYALRPLRLYPLMNGCTSSGMGSFALSKIWAICPTSGR